MYVLWLLCFNSCLQYSTKVIFLSQRHLPRKLCKISMESNNNPSDNATYSSWSVIKSRKRKQTDVEMADKNSRPYFPPAKKALLAGNAEMSKIPVPPNRQSPLKANWAKIFTTVVQHLHLNIRFNLKTRMVEIKTCKETKDISALRKASDFVQAFALGFEVEVRLNNLS
ncbi:RNA-binding protein pno1-like [Stegodyphus dumicola]|uniref:RNA-binding protein pno1-like n=1 Tax=Stegodyphus dumicola TaxID=202533 RepID=UPI0015AEB6B5|nr:RNA-binding protein pno1-like [Stegodyphus dumicola]